MSTWDDGTEFDRRLVDIFNRHGLKGGFFLNSGGLDRTARDTGWRSFVRSDEVKSLYARHEIGSHTVSHPHVWRVSREALCWEFLEDRRRLEALTGYPIRGAVIPFGLSSGREAFNETLRVLGFRYARHTDCTNGFDPPADFLAWRPTSHCSANLGELWTRFASVLQWTPGALLNLWGHSYELEDGKRWDEVEAYASAAGTDARIWHATPGEVYDYLCAWRNLSWSVDGRFVQNTSAVAVYVDVDGGCFKVNPGAIMEIE